MWRDISLTTPQLWSRISLDIGLQGKSFEVEANLMDTWLSRTGQYPLSIEIFRTENFQLTRHVPKPLIPKALIESCCRWKYLRLSGSWSWLYGGALNGVRNHISNLQNLVYDQAQNDASFLHSYGPITIFEETPQLRYHRCRSMIHPSAFTLPWAQLVGFSAEHMSDRQCYDVLSRAPNLLTFSISAMSQSRNPPLHPIHHSHLRSLCITLPALLELQYTEVPAKSLLDFLSRTGCPLQTLVLGLSSAAVRSGYDARIIQLLPSLSELQLTHHATDDLLSRLAYTPYSEILVPKLHTIKLVIGDGKKLYSRLADMIESRWKFSGVDSQLAQHQLTPLKQVRLSIGPNIGSFDSNTHMRLRRLCNEGLDICFTGKDGAAVGLW